ncbi:MAG TPA: alpha/beta fold hydrolase, partial [Anaerolineae bacterium]|nr:alpha/beta fold hydrolase [Anaerolineae bacterium]
MIAEDVNFANGEIRLTGTLYRPTGTGPFPVMVVLHAATGGTRHYPFYQHLKTVLPANGCAVLIFDRRGSGESTGNFATASFDDLATDGLAAFGYLLTRDDVDHKRIGLYGISQGAW